jgi:rSAM/selenodomain-associated transferase 1
VTRGRQNGATAYAFPQARILVFAKAPAPGRVKRRLIPALGREGAAALHESLVLDTLARTTTARLAPVELWCHPDGQDPFLRACGGRFEVVLRVQKGDGLGERMQGALRRALADASCVLIVGCDCPGVDAAALRAALRLMDDEMCDAVFGTVEDGGYGMIGARRPGDAPFRDIDWGTDRVMSQTRRQLRAAGWRWAEMPVGRDVDRPEDLTYPGDWRRSLQGPRGARSFVPRLD